MAEAAPSAGQKPPPPPPTAAPPPPPKQTNPAIPVGLNEAALDSPTFRAIAVHFGDQVDAIERWLDGYVKATTKLAHDMLALEETINSYLSKSLPPTAIGAGAGADGVIDTDYTLLALKRIGDGSREWWTQTLGSMRRMDSLCAEPIRAFLGGELRSFKDARKALEAAQKTFDATLARYVSQSKTKEPSALREDAFAVYETRKAYLKASMDYCQLAPQIRFSLDKLLVRVCADVWREMKRSRDAATSPGKWGDEMERIRGWSREMEASEGAFRRELQIARRDIGESTLASFKPSRELEDYSASTVPFLGSRGPMSVRPKDQGAVISEKQGWLFLRTITGKPVRTSWVRRWYYCKNGIFGWLVQGPQGVLQGDEIGVLLCSAKPAVQEERRFCFEVKTKSQTILLQAETQTQLTEWLEVFEVAKKHAFEMSMGRDNSSMPGGVDPAFAINPPSIPEFSAKMLEGLGDDPGTVERSTTLPVPADGGNLTQRASFDVTGAAPRRSVTTLAREEGESRGEHATRIMQKLDLHRKAVGSEMGSGPSASPGGIASLISASQTLIPGYAGYQGVLAPSASPRPAPVTVFSTPLEARVGGLAPITLAKPPVPTNLSRQAVVASAERAMSAAAARGMPTAVVANYWGSNPWGDLYASKVETSQGTNTPEDDPFTLSNAQIAATMADVKSPASGHRKSLSVDAQLGEPKPQEKPAAETFPPNYPVELKAQHAQFRLLFPSVPQDEKLVLVFNAAWSSSTEENSTSPGLAGNGRIFVTPDDMYFFGHQMGLVVAYTIHLDIITEVTSAPGRDCDYIFLHLNQNMNNTGFVRITIKTFLEDLPLLHARLNLLIDDLQAEEPMDVPEIITALVSLEREDFYKKSPSVESWEEVSSNTPMDDGTISGKPVSRRVQDISDRYRSMRFSRKAAHNFQLPSNPVYYEPEDMQKRVSERHFEISAKACFHVLFGDKSFIFPKLYFERRAKEIAQGPWQLSDHGKMRRQFRFKVDYVDMLGRSKLSAVMDEQTIDVFSDHVTYVVTHVKTPWHLPHSQHFKLVTKVVITHLAKSKCNLAIYTKVDWTDAPAFAKSLVQRQAMDDAARDAEELAEVATDQVRKLGPHSRTKRAIQVYGNIGQQTQVVVFTPNEAEAARTKPQIKPRTLTAMLFETLRSFAESAISSVMMWAFAALRKLFNVVSAHRLIILLLAVSAVLNVVVTSGGSSTWWSERRAAKYMSRIGIGPNVMMSRAIYLTDLAEASRGTSVVLTHPQDSECYDTFRAIMNATDMDAPHDEVGTGAASTPTSRAAARRLRRTRQRLGSYRHDLLVAMRVVNSIEQEMIQSEWENWLADENLRCEQAAAMLREAEGVGGKEKDKEKGNKEKAKGAGTGSSKKGTPKPVDEKRLQALRTWHQAYCGSCQADQQLLAERGRGEVIL